MHVSPLQKKLQTDISDTLQSTLCCKTDNLSTVLSNIFDTAGHIKFLKNLEVTCCSLKQQLKFIEHY